MEGTDISKQPTCVGDNDQTWMVEWSVPHFGRGTEVFESSVTVWAQRPDQSGICGDDAMRNAVKSQGTNGFFGSQGGKDSYQIASSGLLFSRSQMKTMCDTCGMSMAAGSCGQYARRFNHLTEAAKHEYCGAAGGGYTLAQAKAACAGERDWQSTCELEMCANGGAEKAMTLLHLEESIEEHLKDVKWPADARPDPVTIGEGGACGRGIACAGGLVCREPGWFQPHKCLKPKAKPPPFFR